MKSPGMMEQLLLTFCLLNPVFGKGFLVPNVVEINL